MHTSAAPAATATTPTRLVVVLGLLTAFAPLSTTMYVPAMPAMADDLGAGPSAVQLTISGLAVGLALGQLVSGPLSDRLGRKRPLLVGLAVYVAACLVCAVAASTGVLIAARVLQGVAGAAGIVIGRAIVRDLHSGAAAARLFSLLVLVTGVTPVLAPLLGGQLLLVGSWRSIFVAQAVVGTLVVLAAARVVPETLPAHRRRPETPLAVTRGAVRLLRDRTVLGCALTCGLVYGATLASISGSGFVLQGVYGVSEQAAAALFALAAAGMIAASRVASRLVERHGVRRMLTAGVTASATSGLLALVAVVSGAGPGLFVCALTLSFAAHAVTLPNATALALTGHPEAAGSASAALGVVQYGIGALAAPLAGVAGGDTALPLALAVSALAVGAAVASALTLHRPGPTRPGPAVERRG